MKEVEEDFEKCINGKRQWHTRVNIRRKVCKSDFSTLGRFVMLGHHIYICISFVVSQGRKLCAGNIPEDSPYIQIALPRCLFRAKVRHERFDMRTV